MERGENENWRSKRAQRVGGGGEGERKGGEACRLVTRILIVYAICANINWIQLY